MRNDNALRTRSGSRTYLEIPDWRPSRGGRTETAEKAPRVPLDPFMTPPIPAAQREEVLPEAGRESAPKRTEESREKASGGAAPIYVEARSALPEKITDPIFTPGYLQTQIGKALHVEFYIGAQKSERSGVLVQVGADYLVLASPNQGKHTVCDLASAKFVTVFGGNQDPIE